jgi:rhodanese-related sulfurtransferase
MKSSMRALSVQEVQDLSQRGGQLVDVREAADFEGAFFVNSLNIGLKGKYATWCGTVLNHDDPIVVIAEAGEEEEAVMRLGRIGFDNVAGYLAKGMAALENHPELVRKVDRITAPALADLLQTPNAPVVVDVRSEKEWTAGHIDGSINIPLPHLAERLNDIPADQTVVLHCEGGYRSSIACSLLAKAGRKNMNDLVGGFKAWMASKLPSTATETSGVTCGTSCSK